MRFIIGVIIAIGLIVMVLILLLRGPSTPPTNYDLMRYANTGTAMRLTIDGPITAEQTHREIQITVDNSLSSIAVIQGYQGRILRQRSYASNVTAYSVFLRALQLAGFNRGKNAPSLRDERGYCPLGERYIMEIVNGSQVSQHYWATSCGGQGNYQGHLNTVISLFTGQIPDYSALTVDLGF